MESVKTNEEELTSTMGSLMSTSKDEKNDASDSTPTSSTDAFTTTSTSHIAADDPISSTSSDVLDSKRMDRANDVSQSSSQSIAPKTNPTMSSLKSISIGDHTSIVSEKDLLDMNITDTSTEKITENVDDIVQDLENLLGEPTTTFDFTIRSKENSNVSQRKDISMDLDDFSMEFQMPEEQPKDTTVKPASIETNRTADIQKNQIEDVNKIIPQDIKENNFLNCLKDDPVNHSEAIPAPVHIEEDNIETPVGDRKDIDSSASKYDEIKPNLEPMMSIRNDESSESNICTDNTAETKENEMCDTVENLETADITSTDSKVEEKVDHVEESRDLDVPSQNLANSCDVNKEISDFNNSGMVETSHNISEENDISGDIPSSQVEKVETQNKDEELANSTDSQNGKLEESKAQEQDAKSEETQVYPSPPPSTIEHESAEETQTAEISSQLTSSQDGKQNQEVHLSIVQDVEMEETSSSQITTSEREVVEEQHTQEDISHLNSSEDVEMEEKRNQEVDSPQVTTTGCETEEKKQFEEIMQDQKEIVSDLSSSADVAVEKQRNQETDFQQTTVSQAEEQIQDAPRLTSVQPDESPEEVTDLSELTVCQVPVEEKRSEDQFSYEKQDEANLTESQVTIKDDEVREQDLPHVDYSEKAAESVEDSSRNAAEDVPDIEEKSIDIQDVAENLEQSQGEEIPSLSDAGEVEPTDESEPSKTEENKEKVHSEYREELLNSQNTEDQQQDLCGSQNTEAETCGIVAAEPTIETEQEVTHIDSVKMKELVENGETFASETENTVEFERSNEETLSDVINKHESEIDVQQVEETNKIEPNEIASIQPVTSSEQHAEQSEEPCRNTDATISEEFQAVERSIQPEEESQMCEKQLDTEECTKRTSMTLEEDLKDLDTKITESSDISSLIPVDPDPVKQDVVDSVENSDVPIEDVATLDNVLNDNMIMSSCISEQPLDVFNESAEAAPSANDDNLEVPANVSVDGFNLIPPFIDSSANIVDEAVELPTSSSTDNVKNLEEAVIENNMLPLVMEDVPDLDVLNAISSLDDNKQSFMPEIADNLGSSDTLLASNSLTNEEQSNTVPFDSNLPTVDEIFAEQSDQQPVDLPDDNLETLLAVASLQGVCETDSAYNIHPVEDLTYVPEEPPMKIQDDKIESLFEDKEAVEGIAQEPTELESVNEAIEGATNMEETEQETKLKEPLMINVDDAEKDKAYSPKIIIKPIKPSEEEEVTSASGEPDEKEGSKGSLKMTITKQSDTMHSILKIYDPDSDGSQNQEQEETQPEPTVPKLIIKPIVQPNEQPQSPKMSTRSSKQVFSPTSSGNQRSASPRITIKPIVKPDNLPESVGPVKITIKPVLKPEEGHRQKHSPKLTIKPIVKPEEESVPETKVHSPRVTIKPIVKPPEEVEQVPSPRITIKPIVKPDIVSETVTSTPRVTIKPVVKPAEKMAETTETVVERSSPKITIKPIVKPQEPETQLEDFEESIKERIVLKINKGNRPGSSKELRKRELPQEEEKSEKLAKIKLKFSKEGGHAHIVQDESLSKRSDQAEHDRPKRQKIDTESLLPGVTITPIPSSHSKLKEMLSKSTMADKVVTIEDDDDDVTIVEDALPNKPSPIVISEESNQDSINVADMRDPISEIPVFEITPDSVKTINPQAVAPVVVETPVTLPAPRKRGRPRKVPLQVREDFKDPKDEEPKPVVVESTRPKRSCRGQSVRTTLGIKPRKPRGGGRGRGSKRGMGTRSTPTPPESPQKPAKEPKLSAAKLKQLKEDLIVLTDKTEVKIEIDDGLHKSPSQSLLAPPHTDNSTTDRADIVMYEEETRMSAETSSRAQTPAKQVVSSIPNVDIVEESQSSVQSTATTESVKVRKGPRLEVHQEPEGAVISADQLAEYYWSGGGPFMLQEQVAQFLGIKSFKRKYPNIPRRVVDMQERDFIRESGLAGEAMCDLGLTAVNSTDILDIMYSDFQDKYEEYCKHQRDRQAKDLANKQKALSLAASQEKTKIDITQQAVQSAATWNATFNKARRDQRKACMDLQTLTVHFPKGKMKQINKPKLGHYPVALVPGQYTDYYAEFTPTEINNLPLNTLCYDPVVRAGLQEMECDSQTDGSGSESDSSTSDSDSSYSGSSDGEDCTLCNKPTMKRVAAAQ